jgi:hypothetical protein
LARCSISTVIPAQAGVHGNLHLDNDRCYREPAQQGVAIPGFEIATVAALPRNDDIGTIHCTINSHPGSLLMRRASQPVTGESEKVSEAHSAAPAAFKIKDHRETIQNPVA